MSKHLSEPKSALLRLILITTKVWANLAIKLGLPISYFHRPYASICQMYSGAVSVNTRQTNRIAGAAHSNCPCFR